MDSEALIGGAIGFIVGFWIRGSVAETKIEAPPCSCVCHIAPTAVQGSGAS